MLSRPAAAHSARRTLARTPASAADWEPSCASARGTRREPSPSSENPCSTSSRCFSTTTSTTTARPGAPLPAVARPPASSLSWSSRLPGPAGTGTDFCSGPYGTSEDGARTKPRGLHSSQKSLPSCRRKVLYEPHHRPEPEVPPYLDHRETLYGSDATRSLSPWFYSQGDPFYFIKEGGLCPRVARSLLTASAFFFREGLA